MCNHIKKKNSQGSEHLFDIHIIIPAHQKIYHKYVAIKWLCIYIFITLYRYIFHLLCAPAYLPNKWWHIMDTLLWTKTDFGFHNQRFSWKTWFFPWIQKNAHFSCSFFCVHCDDHIIGFFFSKFISGTTNEDNFHI